MSKLTKYLALGLLLTGSSAFGQLVGGFGYANINVDLEDIGSVNIGAGYVSLGYNVKVSSAQELAFMPEVRFGTGLADDTIDVFSVPVEVSADRFVSISLRIQYDVNERFYVYASPAYTYLKAEASAGDVSESSSDWEFGAGLGAGLKLAKALAVELNTELYEDTVVVGGSLKYFF